MRELMSLRQVKSYMPAPVRRIARRLRRAVPRFVSHYLFVRDLRQPVTLRELPPGAEFLAIESESDPSFPQVVAISAEHDLDPAWCIEQLRRGGRAWLLLLPEPDGDASDAGHLGVRRPAAIRWGTPGPFWVEEVAHTINPDGDAVYGFGAFVPPRFRGKGLLRVLVSHEIAAYAAAGRDRVYGCVNTGNTPSLKSFFSEGFQVSARLDQLQWSRHSLVHIRRLHLDLPVAQLEFEGFPQWRSLHVARRQPTDLRGV